MIHSHVSLSHLSRSSLLLYGYLSRISLSLPPPFTPQVGLPLFQVCFLLEVNPKSMTQLLFFKFSTCAKQLNTHKHAGPPLILLFGISRVDPKKIPLVMILTLLPVATSTLITAAVKDMLTWSIWPCFVAVFVGVVFGTICGLGTYHHLLLLSFLPPPPPPN